MAGGAWTKPMLGRGGEVDALLARIRSGDEAAFADLMIRHSGLVRGVAVRTLGTQEAPDACQDVWLRVWLSLDKFRGDSSFKTWLYRVTLNTCLTEHRRASRRRSEETGEPRHALAGCADHWEDPGRALAEGERHRELRLQVLEALSGVREEHRAALVLHHAEGLSYQEVAEELGVPSGTAKGWAHRAKAKVQAATLAAAGSSEGAEFRR